MRKNKRNELTLDHVKLRDTGSVLPVVFDIEEGYRRGSLFKSDEGEYIFTFSVSNIKADETTPNYERKENEEVTPIYGFIIHNKKEAEVISEFFKTLANEMEEQ